MDKTVPAGAAVLLDFIRQTEVGSTGRESYDVIYGHNQHKLKKPVTQMTIDQVIASQRRWSTLFGSSATGGYQFMRATLMGLKKELGLTGNEVLEPNLQDRLGYHLLIRRKYHQFISGEIGTIEFARFLAMEWASFPVLADCKGAHGAIRRGQSYYAGDKLNKALVKPEAIERLLGRGNYAEIAIPEINHIPVPVTVEGVDKPMPRSTTMWASIGAFVTTAVTALGSLHPAVAGAVILVAAAFAFWIIRERLKKRTAQRSLLDVFNRGGV